MKKLLSVCVLAAAAWAADAADPSEAFYSAIRANDLPKLQSLLSRGASAANNKDARGLTPLMYAAAVGSAAAMKILIDNGADVNAKNAFDSTSLMWSVTDLSKVRMLVEHGADVNAASKQGHTPFLLASMSSHALPVLRLLSSKGANIKAADNMKMTALLAATAVDDNESVRYLIDAGLDVNAADVTGETPLMNAAGLGNTEVAKWLLAKGAKVNAVSLEQSGGMVKNGPINLGYFTPLILATAYGPADLVKTLLDAGADVNAKEVRGMTPLMLSVSSDHQNGEVIKLLLAHGADVNAKSKLGETAADWARKVGLPIGLAALNLKAATPAPVAVASVAAEVRPAVERGVGLLEKTSAKFLVEGGCVSCHAQNITDVAVNVARAHGVRVDEKAAMERKGSVKGFLGPAAPALLERADPPGSPDTLMYLLSGLKNAAYEPDRLTDAIVANIAAQQHPNGSWHVGGIVRPPIEDGDFFRAALGIQAMKAYGPPGRAAEWADRTNRAKQWLLSAKAETTEDRNMQLLGAMWAGADSATVAKLAKTIAAQQRSDGGWAQHDGLACDAYATGQTLYVLAAAGFKPSDVVFQKGVKHLLATQAADGSWHVASRAPKFQPYFESGFPYGHDQWISAAATGWATAALSHALDAKAALSAAR
jgi:ankyrin repeat protein